jgi:hypothetical protein
MELQREVLSTTLLVNEGRLNKLNFIHCPCFTTANPQEHCTSIPFATSTYMRLFIQVALSLEECLDVLQA